MRQLKFRAWDDKGMVMQYVSLNTLLEGFADDCPFVPNDESPGIADWQPIMQYTGLKDKNGVEIYEGDIIKELHQGGEIGVIEWVDHGFWFMKGTGPCMPYEREVIGNIYENKELLDV